VASCCDKKYRLGVCDVHKLTLNDSSERLVAYCKICKAFICKACNYNYPLRVIAAIKSAAK